MDISGSTMDVNENTDLGVADYESASETFRNAAVPVAAMPHEPCLLYTS